MTARFGGAEMVIFDLDGTLVDTASFAIDAQQRAFRDLGIAEPSAAAIRAVFGLSAGDFYASLLAPYDESIAAELHRVAMRCQHEALVRGEGRTFAGVPELLGALIASGRTVGFCSNGSPEYVGLLVDIFAFHRYGPWRDVTAMGPDRSKKNGIADLMRVARATRAVVVGDRRWDIEAAHALGLPAIACRWGFGSSDELASADWVVESIEALADALGIPASIPRREENELMTPINEVVRTPRFSKDEIRSVWPAYGREEEEALLDVLQSGRWCRLKDETWASGVSGAFERELAEYLRVPHVLAMANGTEAIDLALRALGIGRGDEVLVQASTYFGTVTPVARLGATPVFVDLGRETYNVDVACLESRITPRTRAVITVHLSGLCTDMDALTDVCRRHGLPLIEDCAQSLGSEWQSVRLGTIGDVGTFSFQQDKVLNAGEGGAVVCKDPALFGKMFSLHQGFKLAGSPPHPKTEVSTNLRITAWQAAILRAQLRRLDTQITHRMRNLECLLALLGDDSPLERVLPHPRMSRWSIYSAPFRFLPERAGGHHRDELLRRLHDETVPAFEGHVDPVYRRPVFVDNPVVIRNAGCPNSEAITDEYLSIMQWFFLGKEEWMERLATIVREFQRDAQSMPVAAAMEAPAAVTAGDTSVPKLAILGGTPVRPAPIKPRIRVSRHLHARVNELLEDGCFSDWYGGPRAHEFERAFAKRVGAGYAVAVNSGTSALHLAVAAIGVQPGDEVLMPAAAYVSAASVVIQERAVPVICDIDPASMTLSVDDAARRITARTRAIIPVHFWGCPANMEPLMNLAARHELVVIEDCGQSHGSRVAGRTTGAIGDFGCFSLAPRKHLSTGQGGIVTCRTEAQARRVRELANKGKGNGWLDYKTIGFSYVMTEFEALLGIDGIDRIDEEIALRRAAADCYRGVLASTPLVIPNDPSWGEHVFFKVPIILPSEKKEHRDFMVEALSVENVSCRPPHPPFYDIPWLREEGARLGRPMRQEDYPVTADLLPRIIELESGPNMSLQDVEVSARAVLKIWQHVVQER